MLCLLLLPDSFTPVLARQDRAAQRAHNSVLDPAPRDERRKWRASFLRRAGPPSFGGQPEHFAALSCGLSQCDFTKAQVAVHVGKCGSSRFPASAEVPVTFHEL